MLIAIYRGISAAHVILYFVIISWPQPYLENDVHASIEEFSSLNLTVCHYADSVPYLTRCARVCVFNPGVGGAGTGIGGVGGAGGVPGLIPGAGELSCKSTLLDAWSLLLRCGLSSSTIPKFPAGLHGIFIHVVLKWWAGLEEKELSLLDGVLSSRLKCLLDKPRSVQPH